MDTNLPASLATEPFAQNAWSNESHVANGRVGGTRAGKGPKSKGSMRRRLTVYLPVELLDRARDTVYWTKGLTLAGLIEQALTESLDRKEHLNGQRFPRRLEELKGGRPRRYDRL